MEDSKDIAISLKAAIEIVDYECGGQLIGTAKIITTRLSDLPSVQPERKKGHWKHVDPITEAIGPKGWMPWYCSECGSGVGKHQTAFCPNCGADMRGEQNE